MFPQICSYLTDVTCRLGWQLFQLLGIACLLAFLLQWSGNRLRSCGFSFMGKWYWYFVAPGVACHEAGHAIGCLVTGTRLVKMVPFKPEEDGTLGFVAHERRSGVLGGWANFLIATGPLWLGGLAIAMLSVLFAGDIPIASYGAYFAADAIPGVAGYVCGLAEAVVDAFLLLLDADSLGWRFILWLYLSFCIASEIGLSKVDALHMKQGFLHLLLLLALLNLVPFIGCGVTKCIYCILPYIFILHAMMLFSLAINLTMLGVVLALRYLVRRIMSRHH